MDGKYRRSTVNLARSLGILLVGVLVLGQVDGAEVIDKNVARPAVDGD